VEGTVPCPPSDGVGVVAICLEQGADRLYMAHCHSHHILPGLNKRLVLPFWYRLTQVKIIGFEVC